MAFYTKIDDTKSATNCTTMIIIFCSSSFSWTDIEKEYKHSPTICYTLTSSKPWTEKGYTTRYYLGFIFYHDIKN